MTAPATPAEVADLAAMWDRLIDLLRTLSAEDQAALLANPGALLERCGLGDVDGATLQTAIVNSQSFDRTYSVNNGPGHVAPPPPPPHHHPGESPEAAAERVMNYYINNSYTEIVDQSTNIGGNVYGDVVNRNVNGDGNQVGDGSSFGHNVGGDGNNIAGDNGQAGDGSAFGQGAAVGNGNTVANGGVAGEGATGGFGSGATTSTGTIKADDGAQVGVGGGGAVDTDVDVDASVTTTVGGGAPSEPVDPEPELEPIPELISEPGTEGDGTTGQTETTDPAAATGTTSQVDPTTP